MASSISLPQRLLNAFHKPSDLVAQKPEKLAKEFGASTAEVETAISTLLSQSWFFVQSGKRGDPVTFISGTPNPQEPLASKLTRGEFNSLPWNYQASVIVDSLGLHDATISVGDQHLPLRQALETNAAISAHALKTAGVPTGFAQKIVEAVETKSSTPLEPEFVTGFLEEKYRPE